MSRYEVELAPDPDSVARARRALGEVSDQLSPRRYEDALLLVSELVTNAIRHASLPREAIITLVVVCEGSALRIEVRDPGSGFVLVEREPDLERSSGWGLYLVRELSDRWGIERDNGSRVWFEFDPDGA